MKWLTLIFMVFILQTGLIFLLEYRRPQRLRAWLFIMYVCPPLGFLVYYFLGKEYANARKADPKGERLMQDIRKAVSARLRESDSGTGSGDEAAGRRRLLRLIGKLSDAPVSGCNQTQMLTKAGEAYDSMLEAMEQAEEHIHMEFYIFRDDYSGGRFQEMMLRKARQGVRVRLLCDGMGSISLGAKFVQQLRRGGVEVHFFLPLLMSAAERRLNFRSHRKLLIVDGKVGFTGGMNIGDEYLGQDPELGYWRDMFLRIEGDAVYELQFAFLKHWRLASGDCLSHPRLFPSHACSGEESVKIVGSGPGGKLDTAEQLVFGALSSADRRVWIASPYFIPDPAIVKALESAALAGVDVRILLPAHPDNRLVYYASLSYVEELQRSGVKFYLFRRGFMHSKLMVVDRYFASIGSANLDMRSFYANFELTAVLLHPDTVDKLAGILEHDLRHSDYIHPAVFRARGRKARLLETLSRLLSPLL